MGFGTVCEKGTEQAKQFEKNGVHNNKIAKLHLNIYVNETIMQEI